MSAERREREFSQLVMVRQFEKVPEGWVGLSAPMWCGWNASTIRNALSETPAEPVVSDALVTEFSLSGADRKLSVDLRGEAVPLDKCVCHAIECRSEVIENIADDRRDVERRLLGDMKNKTGMPVAHIVWRSVHTVRS
jgi:hypothetical protein